MNAKCTFFLVSVILSIFVLAARKTKGVVQDRNDIIGINHGHIVYKNTTIFNQKQNYTLRGIVKKNQLTPLVHIPKPQSPDVAPSNDFNTKPPKPNKQLVPKQAIPKQAIPKQSVPKQAIPKQLVPSTPKKQPKPNKKKMIAICAATHSKSSWRSLKDTALQQKLIPSIERFISQRDRAQYSFRLYLAADHDDQFWLKHKEKIRTASWLPVHFGFYRVPVHKIPFNQMMKKAYMDGAEYMVRVNDDSEFVTGNWVTKAVSKLSSYDPPNVGMVGPNCREGNTAIMTHDMVHRTHLDIFETYYPKVFSAWWIDDWISKVYGSKRSTKIKDWVVKHHVHKHGTRYEVQHHEEKLLSGELKKGAEKIRKWLSNPDKDIVISSSENEKMAHEPWSIVVTLSAGFDDMFINWWFHYSKLNLDMNVIMIAEDPQTYEKYSKKPGIEVWKAQQEDSKDTKSFTYNTAQYKKLVSRRASHMLRVLNSKPKIIYTDIDTVWLQDPRPFFSGNFDVWAQLDNVNYYCTGFMAMIKSDRLVNFLKKWNQELDKHPQLNQPIFNKLIHKSNVKHKSLPLKEFPSGKLYFQKNKRDGVVIIHNNFIIGKNKKIERFKKNGLWSTNAPSINAPRLRENYCLDFEHSSMVYKDVVWQTPKQLCVINIQKATILKSGLLFNATSAYTFGKWYWKKHTSEISTSSTFSKKSFVSFVQIWQNVMQHITFDTYPKSRLLCPYLQRNPEIGILVMNNLQRDLIIESCSLPIHRFKNVDKSISAASIAATVWTGDIKMGMVPFNSFTSLGSQTKKGDKVIYIPRKVGMKRSVKNEKKVLELLRRYFGNKLHIYYPKNDWKTDRKIFEQASVIIGPHGGAMANMIFAPVDTTIIEFLPLTRLRSKGENERPCYFGLARGLGFDYHSVEPLHFDFEKPMTVPLLDLEKTLARIQPNRKTLARIQPNRNDCALLFFGLAKHFTDIVLPSIQKYILDVNPDCDIYAHTYDIKEITNPRNNEKNSPVNPLEVYSMTKNVVLDTLDSVSKVRDFKYYRRFRQSGGLHPYSMDNMIKQWHSIDRVWRYANQEHEYERYGLFRLDVQFAEPIDITNGDAVIASFHPDRGLNDRGFYGLYKWAKIWATKRFEQVEAQARRNHNDLNAESFMKYLMRDVPVQLKSMCFNRVRATGEIKRDCKPETSKAVPLKTKNKNNLVTLESLAEASGSDKARVGKGRGYHGYTRYYERIFKPIRKSSVRLVEIGVEKGRSMKMWQQYFSEAEHIYGIGYGNFQKTPSQECYSNTATRVNSKTDCTIYKGDQSDVKFLNHFIKKTGGNFDVIIDDGSHVPRHQLISFETLWPTVKPGGMYIVEDIETNWWKPTAKVYGYSLRNQPNVVEIWKGLIESVNREFTNGHSKLTDQKPGIYGNVVSVEFGQNIIIFHKALKGEESMLSKKYRFQWNLP